MMMEFNEIQNPFPGLRPFELNESNLFFGREGQSDELLARLQRTRFLAVVGTSGSGKSSLIRAGLLPALFGGLMGGAGSSWRIAVLRPGNDPIGNLAAALCDPEVLGVTDQDPELQNTIIETTLRRSTLGLVDATQLARIPSDENLLIVVDQFEELFRFKEARREDASEDDAAAFVKLLLEASDQEGVRIYVVLTMRSDFLGECSQFVGLPEAINQGQYLIPRMSRDERQSAISGPAAVGGGEIALPLVSRLLNDAGDNPDQLPIMQHALMRTWDYCAAHRSNDAAIGIEDYEAIGTMSEALSRHADEALETQPDQSAQVEIAQNLLSLADVEVAQGKNAEAAADYQQIIGTCPSCPQFSSEKAVAELREAQKEMKRVTDLIESGKASRCDYDRAHDRYQAANTLAPEDHIPFNLRLIQGHAHLRLAELYRQQERPADFRTESGEAFKKMQELSSFVTPRGPRTDPRSIEPFTEPYFGLANGLGRLYSESGDNESALRVFSLVNERGPVSESYSEQIMTFLDAYAVSLRKANKLSEAVEIETKAKIIRAAKEKAP